MNSERSFFELFLEAKKTLKSKIDPTKLDHYKGWMDEFAEGKFPREISLEEISLRFVDDKKGFYLNDAEMKIIQAMRLAYSVHLAEQVDQIKAKNIFSELIKKHLQGEADRKKKQSFLRIDNEDRRMVRLFKVKDALRGTRGH